MSRKQRRGGSIIQNVIALLFLLVTLLVVAGFVAVIFMPQLLEMTPLAGLVQTEQTAPDSVPTAAIAAVVPTLTPSNTPNSLLPTWTPVVDEPTPEPTATNTRRPTVEPSATSVLPTKTPTPTPTNTPTSTPTETPIGPTLTPSPTKSAFPFTKTDTSPMYLQNYANSAKCEWMGIAGEVLDLNRNPIAGSHQVHVWGSGIDVRRIAGSAPAYSPSGWEQFLFDSPVIRDYNVQLETTSGTAVSQVYSVQSRASCNQNLMFFTFVQNH